jgi:hypothetical protein
MAQAVTRSATGDGTGAYRSSPWARGASVFAACMMCLLGTLQFLEGLVAVVNGDDFLVRTPNYLFRFDASTWGWTHLILGALVATAGALVFSGNRAARGLGIVLAGLSAVVNFLWLPYYPFWGLVVLTLDVLVIWGLATSRLDED